MKCLVKGDYCFAAYSVLDLISIQCLDILLMAKTSRCQLQTGSEQSKHSVVAQLRATRTTSDIQKVPKGAQRGSEKKFILPFLYSAPSALRPQFLWRLIIYFFTTEKP